MTINFIQIKKLNDMSINIQYGFFFISYVYLTHQAIQLNHQTALTRGINMSEQSGVL